ncbi:ADP-ribosyltransferase [Streptomyces sp. TP-A0356]|uniref:ADP-ribosyltransferase n=1 Tax=Streptomyces sp. TP-A0356 TaxID=1359208 RepID=UPI0006E21F64|nr:ADP-ribosyltransferase [Streptomyces sp. TP-A0356]
MIKPEEIPQFTGNLAELEKDYGDLKADASHLRSTGQDVHSQFQGLSAYYKAPEAELLFATTKPVAERAHGFADGLEKVSSALSSYAVEVRPLVEKLKQLKADATTFVSSVKDDKDWEYDEDKVHRHNQIRDEITATVAAFWAAERTCHNKITALFHGTQMVAGDGSDRKDQYGFNAADMKNAKLPWGDPVEQKHHWYEIGHWVKSFLWDGIVVDGIWGTIKGLGTLVGCDGWAAMGQAWKGLAQLATGLTISTIPGMNALFWTMPDNMMPSWLRESRNTMKQTGKALVAWDEWGKNPARAAGAVTFNVLTTVFTGGEGAAVAGAGKAGAVAKAISLAGKAGRIIDPMTYVGKGVGAGLSKIGDVTKALKGIGHVDIPKLPDGSVHLPDGRLLDTNGNLLGHDGTIDKTPVPHEVAPGLPAHWTIPNQPPVPAGVTHAAADGVHGGVGHTTDGVYGGMPHTSHGVYGGVPHSAGADVHSPATHAPSDGVHGGIPHSTKDAVSAGGHSGPTPAWYHETTVSPTHDVPTTTHEVPGNPHDAPTTTPHPGGHDTPPGGHDGSGHDGSGHDGSGHDGSGHDGSGHDGSGHDHHDAGHDGTGHDAAHVGDHGGVPHDLADTGAHHGADTPAVPGQRGTDVPGHGGAGEPFEYKPHMSVDDFNQLATDAEKHAVATAELERGTNPAPSVTDEAGQNYGDAYWNDFLDQLEPSKREALHTYSGFYYTQINGHLRGKYPDVSPKVLHTIDEMNQVMGARPVPEDVMVIRGTGIDHLNLRSPLEMLGNTYDDPAYTSTALGKTVPGPFRHKPVYMHWRVPKGTPALWIDHISANPGERELLLASGTEYKVTRVFMDEAGKWHVYGEVLPRP